MRLHLILTSLSVFLLSSVTGCVTPYHDARLGGLKLPPDFTLELFVQGPVATRNRRVLRSHYLLEPDGKLHLALAEHAKPDRYPYRYIVLRHAQFQKVRDFVIHQNLLAEPTSPDAQAHAANINTKSNTNTDTPSILSVTLTAWGDTHHYRTTAAESPPTGQLLDMLIELTGGQLPKEEGGV